MTSLSPHLCAHLTHGQPTLDIAVPIDGTPSDPGPWWITSAGHRIRPYWTMDMAGMLMDDTNAELVCVLDCVPPPPDDAEDSWCANAAPDQKSHDIIQMLGLGKPSTSTPPLRRL